MGGTANAYLAGTFVAMGCGACGWFVVLRAQVFAGDLLAHAVLVGALAAALARVDARAGALVLAVVLAGGLASGPRPVGDVGIGIALSWISGVAILLIALLSANPGAGGAATAVSALFGSILSLDGAQSAVATGVALAVLGAVLMASRPLLLATVDPEGASLGGIPVRALSAAFLAVVAAMVTEGSQAVGALLVLGLLAAPAGAAHRLTSRPLAGVAASAAIATLSTWGGLALALTIPALPPSSAIIGLAAVAYVAATAAARRR